MITVLINLISRHSNGRKGTIDTEFPAWLVHILIFDSCSGFLFLTFPSILFHMFKKKSPIAL